MAGRLPARLSAGQGRTFGFTLGTAFLLLSLLMWWRNHTTIMASMLGLALLFVGAALFVPERLGGVQRVWLRCGQLISRITTPVIMAVLYALVFTPVGVIIRLRRRSPIVHKAEGGTYFRRRTPSTAESMQHQY